MRVKSSELRVANCVAAVLAAAMLVGCESEPAAQPLSVTDTIERGPISFTVEASPKQVWLGDPITIELRFHTPDGYDVQFPTADALLDLTVGRLKVDHHERGLRPVTELALLAGRRSQVNRLGETQIEHDHAGVEVDVLAKRLSVVVEL